MGKPLFFWGMDIKQNTPWAQTHDCNVFDDRSFDVVKHIATARRKDFRDALKRISGISDTAAVWFDGKTICMEAAGDGGNVLAHTHVDIRPHDAASVNASLPATTINMRQAMQAMKGMKDYWIWIVKLKRGLGLSAGKLRIRLEPAWVRRPKSPDWPAVFSVDAKYLLKCINDVCAGIGGTTQTVFAYPIGKRLMLTDGSGRSYTDLPERLLDFAPFGLPVAAVRKICHAADGERITARRGGSRHVSLSFPDAMYTVRTTPAPQMPDAFMPRRFDPNTANPYVDMRCEQWIGILTPALMHGSRRIGMTFDALGLHYGFASQDRAYVARVDVPPSRFDRYTGSKQSLGFSVNVRQTVRLIERSKYGNFTVWFHDERGAVAELSHHYYGLPWDRAEPAEPLPKSGFKPDATAAIDDARSMKVAMRHILSNRPDRNGADLRVFVEIGGNEIILNPEGMPPIRAWADCLGASAGTFSAARLNEAFGSAAGRTTLQIANNRAARISWDASVFLSGDMYVSRPGASGRPNGSTAAACIADHGVPVGGRF